MNRYIIGITDYECAASQRGVTVYQNNTNTVREVFADEENCWFSVRRDAFMR